MGLDRCKSLNLRKHDRFDYNNSERKHLHTLQIFLPKLSVFLHMCMGNVSICLCFFYSVKVWFEESGHFLRINCKFGNIHCNDSDTCQTFYKKTSLVSRLATFSSLKDKSGFYDHSNKLTTLLIFDLLQLRNNCISGPLTFASLNDADFQSKPH